MIVIDLCCEADHRFEGWFASSGEVEMQRERGLLSCPVCDSHAVRRLPSAPSIVRGNSSSDTPSATGNGMLNDLLRQLRDSVDAAEDVGKRFAEEARRIHYGDSEERAIRGTASLKDMGELIEEGIDVLPVPPRKDDLH